MKFKSFFSIPVMVFLLMLLSSTVSYSQEEIVVKQLKESMSQGEQTGFQTIIPQAVVDNVKKAWIKQVQQGVKSKVVEDGSEISIAGALVKEISANPIDIYCEIKAVDTNTQIIAFFVIDSAFYDGKEEKVGKNIENYIRNFAVLQYEAAVEDELKMEEDKLKDLNKQLSDQQKNEEKMENSIKDEEKKISAAQDEIGMLESEKTQQMTAIEQKRVAAATIIDKDAKKASGSEIKALEKERDKTDKELNKQKDAIDKSKGNIEDYEKAIEESKTAQEELTEQIEKQEGFVQQVETKLKGIR